LTFSRLFQRILKDREVVKGTEVEEVICGGITLGFGQQKESTLL
jgi:hypothetical protein